MTQEPQNAGASLQALEYTEYVVNSLAESAKQHWKWWGSLAEPMIRATDEWADIQREYLNSLKESQAKQGGEEQRTKVRQASSAAPPAGYSFDLWPGPGDSEGGGWDR